MKSEDRTMRAMLKRFVRDTRGATSIEYGLIAALLAIGIIGAVGFVADGTNSTFETVSEAFPE